MIAVEAGKEAYKEKRERGRIRIRIRKAEIAKWRKKKDEFHKQRLRFDLPGKGIPKFKGEAHDPPRLEVTNESGETVLSIVKVPDPGLVRWEDAKGARGKKSQIDRLTPFLSAVPDLLVAGSVHTTNFAVVNLPLENLLNALGPDGKIIGKRGYTKRFAEHAVLKEPTELLKMVNYDVLLRIASVALAQKHLYDISKNLDRISEQLEEIGRFQREERFSNLEGTLREFMQMKREMADYSFDHISVDAVASECIQLSKIERHIRKDVSRAIDRLGNVDGLGAEFDQEIDRVVMLLKEFRLCVTAKLYGCQIMAIVSKDPGWLDSRLEDVQDDVKSLTEHYDSTVDEILDKLGKDKHSPESLELVSGLRSSGELEGIVGSVDMEMGMTRELVRSLGAPVSVLLKVNGDEVEGFAVAES
ncbi:MAG: hypothetical protein OXJ64_09640 [Boseongicola sp.]|nr:hypothetical protein [Boseongicola sp.]